MFREIQSGILRVEDINCIHAGMQKLVAGCPELGKRPEFARIANLRSIDCIATRLWFDRRVATRFPANVLSGFEECTGGTWFNLNDLQVKHLFCLSDMQCGSPTQVAIWVTSGLRNWEFLSMHAFYPPMLLSQKA